jgi:hypothetical protein
VIRSRSRLSLSVDPTTTAAWSDPSSIHPSIDSRVSSFLTVELPLPEPERDHTYAASARCEWGSMSLVAVTTSCLLGPSTASGRPVHPTARKTMAFHDTAAGSHRSIDLIDTCTEKERGSRYDLMDRSDPSILSSYLARNEVTIWAGRRQKSGLSSFSSSNARLGLTFQFLQICVAILYSACGRCWYVLTTHARATSILILEGRCSQQDHGMSPVVYRSRSERTAIC